MPSQPQTGSQTSGQALGWAEQTPLPSQSPTARAQYWPPTQSLFWLQELGIVGAGGAASQATSESISATSEARLETEMTERDIGFSCSGARSGA